VDWNSGLVEATSRVQDSAPAPVQQASRNVSLLSVIGVLSFDDEFRETVAEVEFRRNSDMWRRALATTSSDFVSHEEGEI